MSANPAFASTPIVGQARIAAANTNRDGSGTVYDLVTAGASGTYIKNINIKATVTTTAGMIRFYYYDGTNTRGWKEVPVTAIVVSASVAGFEYDLPVNESIPTGTKIKVSSHSNEQIDITAFGGDL